jgi:predicted hydrolase (HD superfamily)
MNREHAWNLVCEYTQSESLRRHMVAVELALRPTRNSSAKMREMGSRRITPRFRL